MALFKKKQNNSSKKRFTLFDDNVPFQVTEAYKTLRTNIVMALATQRSKVFAVSSANAGEGKSTTAANLAIVFSQAGKKVLLIDADMRKPVQHRAFKFKNDKGLSTLLGGIDSFKQVLKSKTANLDIITSGPIPPNPSEMLASENMKILLDELVKYYDYVIIDTPPINVVTDTLTLSPHIGGIAMVTRSGVATYDEVSRAATSIEFANGKLLGVIVTAITEDTATYKRGYYKKYYRRDYAYRASSYDPAVSHATSDD